MLRIISGIYKGKKIQEPDSKFTRPTTEKVREAVFSSLQFKLEGASCLDLFAGSGAWSVEAESRGAKKVVALDNNRQVFKVLSQNIESLKTSQIQALNMDAISYLESNTLSFDFIFIDAPFKEFNLVNQALEIIASKNLLSEDGEIIIETDMPREIIIPNTLRVFKDKRHGRINLLYICHN